ncbi:anhydro-N-acetylmuramic acid kinase [Winogradskyella jejuensis]|nr:anhydro-N-acetylmuramic acid kinase [Winogradskyella jejuensis]
MLTKSYNVVSVMSGTSLDGIDLLYAKFLFFGQLQFEILDFETVKYPRIWYEKLKTLTQYSKDELKTIDDEYSVYLAEKISEFIIKRDIRDIDFVASHGHTALHNPEDGYTCQIGNQQILADKIGKKVICDFRVQDVNLGGQGAPLVPIGDKLLFSEYDFCVNLGGFANISFDKNRERIAFDICPVNIVLNYFVSSIGIEYDDKGKISKSGLINSELLKNLNALPFYNLNPPKSLGLEWVQQEVMPLIERFDIKTKDLLRTFVEHAAIQISKYLDNPNSKVLITGGGAYNLFLIERIKALSEAEIIIPDKAIIEYKEALIFGLLGVLKDRNEINCLKSVTGAKKDHSSGVIFHPKINV